MARVIVEDIQTANPHEQWPVTAVTFLLFVRSYDVFAPGKQIDFLLTHGPSEESPIHAGETSPQSGDPEEATHSRMGSWDLF